MKNLTKQFAAAVSMILLLTQCTAYNLPSEPHNTRTNGKDKDKSYSFTTNETKKLGMPFNGLVVDLKYTGGDTLVLLTQEHIQTEYTLSQGGAGAKLVNKDGTKFGYLRISEKSKMCDEYGNCQPEHSRGQLNLLLEEQFPNNDKANAAIEYLKETFDLEFLHN